MTRSEDISRTYDWSELRAWCAWYINVFLQFAGMTEDNAHNWFRGQINGRMLDWCRVRVISDTCVRYTVETITAQVSEAVATREALPGDFADLVSVLRQEETLLNRDLPPEATWLEIQKIEN
jgi:hypothetical protein